MNHGRSLHVPSLLGCCEARKLECQIVNGCLRSVAVSLGFDVKRSATLCLGKMEATQSHASLGEGEHEF